jgi:hypothetical protein
LPPRATSRLLLLLLLLAFAAAAYAVLQGRAEAGKGMPAFSVYSDDRDGLATAAGVLRKLGWQPVAVTRPIQQTHDRGLLVLVEPRATGLLAGQTPALSETDAKGLLDWVAKGNTLLLSGREPTLVHSALGVTVLRDPDAARDESRHTAEPGEGGGYTGRIEWLEVEGRDSVRAPRGVPLWWVDGQPAAVLVRHGGGRVLIVPDPSLLTHRGLLRQDNVLFLYNVAALDAVDGRVYFDEYHHGLRSGGGVWGYLRYHDQQWVLLQVLLVAAVAVWGVAVRLGPPVPTPPARRADAVDYAGAVARIYQRAGARKLLAKFLLRDFFETLTHRLRLRRSALPAQILAAWRKRYAGKSDKRLEELLRAAADFRRTSAGPAEVSEQQLWTCAQAFDAFKAEVMRAG